MTASLSERDLLQLNAYLDGELSDQERAAFERKLAQDAALQAELQSLRATVALLGMAERVHVPRSFTLDPAVYGKQAQASWLERLLSGRSAFVTAGALAAVALIAGGVLLFSLIGRGGALSVAMESAAPAPQEPMVMMEAPAEEAEARAQEDAYEGGVGAGAPLPTEAAAAEAAAAEEAAAPEAAELAPQGTATPAPAAEGENVAPPAAPGAAEPAVEEPTEGARAGDLATKEAEPEAQATEQAAEEAGQAEQQPAAFPLWMGALLALAIITLVLSLVVAAVALIRRR
jgi:anti-sigma factor RsiW